MILGPHYLLVVALAGAPSTEWRVEGGYDSCLLMAQMMRVYAPTASTTCVPMDARGPRGPAQPTTFPR